MKEMTPYLYILSSEEDGTYYIGITTNIERRLTEHNGEHNSHFTSGRQWSLCALYRVNGSWSDAMRIEKFIKAQKSRKFIEKLIAITFEPEGKLAQLVRVPHLRD